MPNTQSQFNALPPKQKIMAVIFFLIAAFIVYEVIGIFRGSSKGSAKITASSSSIKASKARPASSQPAVGQNPQETAVSKASPSSSAGRVPQSSPYISRPRVENVAPPPTPYLMQQERAEGNYLKALNELQVLKLKREMAETNQAIMAAKLATVTAEKHISDLLSPQEVTPPPTAIPTTLAPGMSPYGMGAKDSYTVQSVTMEQNQWFAVIKYKDTYYNVAVGDVLPPDGSVVMAIDEKGVTLQQGGVEHRIPLTSTANEPSNNNQSAESSPTSPGGSKAESTRLMPTVFSQPLNIPQNIPQNIPRNTPQYPPSYTPQ